MDRIERRYVLLVHTQRSSGGWECYLRSDNTDYITKELDEALQFEDINKAVEYIEERDWQYQVAIVIRNVYVQL